MQVLHEVAALRAALAPHERPAFVPTMGNLHEGHLALVRRARATRRKVIVSIFVNPLQFGPTEDFATYPRTLAADLEKLAAAEVEFVFAPTTAEMYARPQRVFVQPPPALADQLEGAYRPGFFTGVATVVLKLFNIVQPAAAVFGAKDLQQVRVVQAMVSELVLPIEILVEPTSRAPDGLALSSRNTYLDPTQREEAPRLARVLQGMADALRRGVTGIDALEDEARRELEAHGWHVDYLTIRDALDLAPPDDPGAGKLAVLGAARLGTTRLIDNVEV